MPKGPTTWALLVAAGLFLLFIVLKLRVSLTVGGSETAQGRRKLAAVRKRIRAARDDPKARARAFREAAQIALEELGRPNLAASYARRAERADPDDVSAVGVLAAALRRANRYRALEKVLWRRLGKDEPPAVEARVFRELIALYEGPLRGRAQAVALRRIRERLGASS